MLNSILLTSLAVTGKDALAFTATRVPARTRPRLNGAYIKASDLCNDVLGGDGELPQIIPTNGVPIHLYTNEIDQKALEQLKVLAESPLPTDYVSAMPDVHLGRGVTIGTVFASKDYVCPNAVGVDIGCGMAAIPIDGLYKSQLKPDDLNQIQQLIKEKIPTGRHQHSSPLSGTNEVIDQITAEVGPTRFLGGKLLLPKVTDQLGTLGGGNHFLELVHEEDTGQVWVMLHSGSRNIGNSVAQHYDHVAKHQLQRKGVDADILRGLNYMPIESEEGQNYLRDMEWCQRYAFHNRRVMKQIMLKIVEKVTGKQADMAKAVNIHHNYCACETCGDRKLWVTRKGATSAKIGEMGIIPGNMGSGSYITRGKGNLMSWNSSSHGAGRRMSRTRAKEAISQEEFEESMKGILCDTDPRVKDEAPQAYKDLSVVMKNQESLTEIVHHLLPMVNVKGIGSESSRKYRSPQQQRESLEREKARLVGAVKKWQGRLQAGCKDKAKEERAQAKLSWSEEQVIKVDERLAALSLESN